MRKYWLFTLSFIAAVSITAYLKDRPFENRTSNSPEWKTFIKNSNRQIASHLTTHEELTEAKIAQSNRSISRSPDSLEKAHNNNPRKNKNSDDSKFLKRNGRILMGDNLEQHSDPSSDLEMINKINPQWNELLGIDLMRFQKEGTKVFVKKDRSLINIEDNVGQFLEEVVVTYLMDNGDRTSFRALVDSETGLVQETWDRTIHDKTRHKKRGLVVPMQNDSAIIAR